MNTCEGLDMYNPNIQINAQYLKDLSFENPKILEIMAKPLDNPPGCGVEVEINARQAGENAFEVTLQIKLETRVDEKSDPISILEIAYAGVFTLPKMDEVKKKEAILVQCPTILFPFVRSLVADITKESGLMPITLTPVDFKALFEQKQAQAGGVKKEKKSAEKNPKTKH